MKRLTTPRPVPVDLSTTPEPAIILQILDNWVADFEALLGRRPDAWVQSAIKFHLSIFQRNRAALRAGKALTGEDAMELGGRCFRVLEDNREPLDIQSEAAYLLLHLEPEFAEAIRQRFAANKRSNRLAALGIERVSP